MNSLYSGTIAAATIAGGWILVASLYSRADAAIVLQPVVHTAYDSNLIDFEISQHESQVKGDPEGAIGWAMLSGAYLARSRESDSDQFAWKAEAAAAKSLQLRVRRNQNAWTKLVQSMLEQHRFQDALTKTEEGIRNYPDDIPLKRMKADVLIEVGKLDEAAKLLATVRKGPNDPATGAIDARLASLRGDHQGAIALFRSTMASLAKNPSVSEPGLAWYVTKIATEQEAMGDFTAAQASFDEAVRLYPRSYKAWLGEARLAMAKHDYETVVQAANKTLEVANSLDARALRADAWLAQGNKAKAQAEYAAIRDMYHKEVATFDGLGKGGPLHVKPIDRQFATFAAKHRMFEKEALVAAKRDYQNRPDEIAKSNLEALTKAATQ
jgi:tetratricopeptide (TPR) repeat protein